MKIHKAKKSLGQNFLKSEQALREIIKAGEIKQDDVILEIGPGKGALTEKLLENSNHVIAIEKDRELFAFLQEKFKEEIENKKLILLEEDVLDFHASGMEQVFSNGLAISPKDLRKNIVPSRYKVIANIPYNITGAILKKFLTETYQPELMVLMVQHEVAKRIVANDKKESILSVSVKAYGTPKMIMKVPARYFSPAPKVDSAVIKIHSISRNLFLDNKIKEERFWEIIHAAFAHKRKVLIGNLKNVHKTINWLEILEKIGLTKNTRAEDVRLEDWITLLSFIK